MSSRRPLARPRAAPLARPGTPPELQGRGDDTPGAGPRRRRVARDPLQFGRRAGSAEEGVSRGG